MFGSMGNMAGMMKKVQKMQADMAKMQEELKQRSFEASVGGGTIAVIMNGEKMVQSIKISPEAVDPSDIETLEDLIVAAINECMRKIDDTLTNEMGKLTGGMNLPPGLF